MERNGLPDVKGFCGCSCGSNGKAPGMGVLVTVIGVKPATGTMAGGGAVGDNAVPPVVDAAPPGVEAAAFFFHR